MRKISIMALLIMLSSCASRSPLPNSSVSTKAPRPDWANLEKTSFTKKGKVYFLGFSDSTGSNRVAALIRVADFNARRDLSQMIVNQLDSLYQQFQLSDSNPEISTRSYGSEMTKLLLTGITIEKRYWERVPSSDEDNDRIDRIHAYSLASISKEQLTLLMRETLRLQGANKSKIEKKIEKKFLNNLETL